MTELGDSEITEQGVMSLSGKSDLLRRPGSSPFARLASLAYTTANMSCLAVNGVIPAGLTSIGERLRASGVERFRNHQDLAGHDPPGVPP